MTAKKPKARYAAVVRAGGFDVVDPLARERLRERAYRAGDHVMLEIHKARNPKFNGFAHKFGEMLAQNIDAFSGMNSHAVLKRLQLEANVGCDEMALLGEFGQYLHRIPRSLSFESMDEGEFNEVIGGMARHVVKRYWPGLTAEQVQRMAELVPNAA
jgi:hypothetical protein